TSHPAVTVARTQVHFPVATPTPAPPHVHKTVAHKPVKRAPRVAAALVSYGSCRSLVREMHREGLREVTATGLLGSGIISAAPPHPLLARHPFCALGPGRCRHLRRP